MILDGRTCVALRLHLAPASMSRTDPMNVRGQAALVRALLDELESLSRRGSDEACEGDVNDQMVEELVRLGCTLLEVASTLTARDVELSARGAVFVGRSTG